MSVYRLTIRVAQKWVPHYRAAGKNLCCAFAFEGDYSKVEYNIIAWAEGMSNFG